MRLSVGEDTHRHIKNILFKEEITFHLYLYFTEFVLKGIRPNLILNSNFKWSSYLFYIDGGDGLNHIGQH